MNEPIDAATAAIGDDEILDIEKRLVGIPSYTTEEADLAEFIADLLTDEGIEAGLQAVSFRNVTMAPKPKSYNVVARLHGSGEGPTLLYNGHMDHGPIGGRDLDDTSNWLRDPFAPVIEDGFLYGKGSQDEKGGICAMLATIIALRRAGIALKGTLIVAPVCGHKTFSRGTHRLMASGVTADMAINTENSGNAIVPIHVGVYKARITVHGAHPHPAIRRRFPELKEQPTPFERVQALIAALGPEARPYQRGGWLQFEPHQVLPDFPWHHIEEVESRGYGERTVHVWWRTPPGITETTLREDLERLLNGMQQQDPAFRGSAVVETYGPALETPQDHPLVASLAKWQRAYSGREADVGPDGRYGGYGDASVMAAAGIPSVAYGPGGGLTDLEHTLAAMEGRVPPDERIPVEDLIAAARTCIAATVELLT